MNLKRTGLRPALAIATIGMLTLAACSSNPDAGASTDDTRQRAFGRRSGGHLSGEIIISGSSTVEPISSIVAEDFSANNPDVQYSVDGPGTGDGFALFCAGEIDIADASRAIKDEEAALCDEAGISYIELQVGIDGLSVITSHDNADVSCLSFADLYALLGPESQGFENWSDADALAEEIGSGDYGEIHAPYPADAPLEITAPGEESGTYDSFVEFAITEARRGARPGGSHAARLPGIE